MLRWLLHRKLRTFERAHGYDAAYMHELLDTDLGAFLKFARATGLGAYRKDVPADVYMAAGLTSSIQADCGPCTQLGVGFALKAGVSAAAIAAVVKADLAAMSPDVALGARFARGVLARDATIDSLREQIVERWGPRAVIALAYAVMAAQLYPALKYATGHGKACTRIVVEGQALAPARAPAEAS
jgi:hypothetical protein